MAASTEAVGSMPPHHPGSPPHAPSPPRLPIPPPSAPAPHSPPAHGHAAEIKRTRAGAAQAARPLAQRPYAAEAGVQEGAVPPRAQLCTSKPRCTVGGQVTTGFMEGNTIWGCVPRSALYCRWPSAKRIHVWTPPSGGGTPLPSVRMRLTCRNQRLFELCCVRHVDRLAVEERAAAHHCKRVAQQGRSIRQSSCPAAQLAAPNAAPHSATSTTGGKTAARAAAHLRDTSCQDRVGRQEHSMGSTA